MKIAIVGSRKLNDENKVYEMIKEAIPRNCSEIVSGGAAGVDTLAQRYAEEHGIHFTLFKPEYSKYGRCATKLRNTRIVDYADMVFAFWDMNSNGTKDTLNKCISKNKPFKIFRI